MPNPISAHNAGWRVQLRAAGGVSWSGVCEFKRSTNACCGGVKNGKANEIDK